MPLTDRSIHVNAKLKCILLDDEIPGLTYLRMLCEQIPEVEVIKAFNDPQKFLSESRTLDFDLCILDIEMPGMSGLQVAALLKQKFVIFTTAYKEHAADAFDLDAIDYVRKPVQKDRLEQAIKKALERHSSKKQEMEFIHLNTDRGKTLIHLNQLGYITTSETDSRDKIAVLLDGSSLTLKNVSFENLLKMLPASRFCRISKREVISLQIVVSYSFNSVTTSMITTMKHSISEVYRQDFQRFANPGL